MKILFSKISDSRNREFSVKTSIVLDGEKRYAIKESVFPEGKPHIERVFKNQRLLKNAFPHVIVAKTWLEEGKLYGEFIRGVPLSNYYAELAIKGDKQKIFELFDWQIGLSTGDGNLQKFSVSEEFEDWFGSGGESLTDAPAFVVCNFDATPENIFIDEGDFQKPCFIDHEWCFDFPIPVCLLAYHMIDLIYLWVKDISLRVSRDEFYRRYLTEDEIALCEKMWDHFISKISRFRSGLSADVVYARYRKSNRALLCSEMEKAEEENENLRTEKNVLQAENESLKAEKELLIVENTIRENQLIEQIYINKQLEAAYRQLIEYPGSLRRHIRLYMKKRLPRIFYLAIVGGKRLLFGPNRKGAIKSAHSVFKNAARRFFTRSR
jgi:hypothetical protein